MTDKAKNMSILSMIIMWFSFLLVSSGSGNALPVKLDAIHGMEYFALINVLGGMGMMLTMPFVGKMGDLFGRKWITVVGAVGYVGLRAVSAYTSSIAVFTILWAVSSIMSGMYNAAPFAIISDVTEEKERPRYFGILATAQALGSMAGAYIGGALADNGYYRWAFAFGIPVMAVAVILLIVYYPNSSSLKTKDGKFDFAGIVFTMLGIIAIIGYVNFGGKLFPYCSVSGVLILLFGLGCLFCMVMIELKHSNPSVPVRLFQYPAFTVSFLANIGIVMYATCLSGYIVVYGQQIMKVSATVTATFGWPNSLALAAGGPIAGMILVRNSKRIRGMAILSLAVTGSALLLWSTLTPTASLAIIYCSTFLGGLGDGLANTVLTPNFQKHISPDEYGAAQSMYEFAGKIGSVLVGIVLAFLANRNIEYGQALTGTFRFSGIYCIVVLLLATFVLKREKDD